MKKYIALLVVILIAIAVVMLKRGNQEKVATTPALPQSTKSADRSQASVTPQSTGPKVEAPEIVANASGSDAQELSSPHWSAAPPANAPVIPPGVQVSAPEVTANINGKSFQPKFHTSFSERMPIEASGKADVTVQWPVEHKATEILATTYNDGTVNGEHGAILTPDKNGKLHFTFQAGEHSGPTQVILRAANLAYTVNFVVPTGNPNVDPPTLQ